ncbi:hypothetical protein V6Z12_D02G084200 [Gossypium hirsutum]
MAADMVKAHFHLCYSNSCVNVGHRYPCIIEFQAWNCKLSARKGCRYSDSFNPSLCIVCPIFSKGFHVFGGP